MSDSTRNEQKKQPEILQADKKIAGKKVTLTFTLPDYYEAECLGKWDDFSEGARFFNDFLTRGNELDELFTFASEYTHNTRDEIQCLVSGAMQAVFATLD